MWLCKQTKNFHVNTRWLLIWPFDLGHSFCGFWSTPFLGSVVLSVHLFTNVFKLFVFGLCIKLPPFTLDLFLLGAAISSVLI